MRKQHLEHLIENTIESLGATPEEQDLLFREGRFFMREVEKILNEEVHPEEESELLKMLAAIPVRGEEIAVRLVIEGRLRELKALEVSPNFKYIEPLVAEAIEEASASSEEKDILRDQRHAIAQRIIEETEKRK